MVYVVTNELLSSNCGGNTIFLLILFSVVYTDLSRETILGKGSGFFSGPQYESILLRTYLSKDNSIETV